MNIEASNDPNEKKFSDSPKIEENNVLCKDGFCIIQNQDSNTISKSQDNKNLFEPIQANKQISKEIEIYVLKEKFNN